MGVCAHWEAPPAQPCSVFSFLPFNGSCFHLENVVVISPSSYIQVDVDVERELDGHTMTYSYRSVLPEEDKNTPFLVEPALGPARSDERFPVPDRSP